jgi:hypothetical protein
MGAVSNWEKKGSALTLDTSIQVGQILLNACCPFLLRHYSAKTASVFIN